MAKNILIVNNTASRVDCSEILRREGYDVAVMDIEDLILKLTDIHNYDMMIYQESGKIESWRFCEGIRRLSLIPLIVISANASADTCVKAINAGADYFLRKSFGPQEFLARVQLLMRSPIDKQPETVNS
jgi:DNA-binding response OmpR family regulator